jgi:hypothetical protein
MPLKSGGCDMNRRVRRPTEDEDERWRELYEGLADFCGVNRSNESSRLVWSRSRIRITTCGATSELPGHVR